MLFLSYMLCRNIGNGHGMNLLNMNFQRCLSMCTIKQGKNFITLGIPWWLIFYHLHKLCLILHTILWLDMNAFEFQGTLNAFVALSKGKLVNMLRSAAMLTPVAYLGQMTSPAFRSIAELFLSEVTSFANSLFDCRFWIFVCWCNRNIYIHWS